MSDVSVERRSPAPIVTWHELQPYVLLAGTLLFVLIYFVGAEEGATSLVSSHYVHEFVHDGRHLLGFPCH